MNTKNPNQKSYELLLPVGNKEMALAAIHGGADAIFLGVPGFNARGRAYDFSDGELKEIISLCRLYGVKVNVAFNVVIFENELNRVDELLNTLLLLGPDAIIVQDLGLASRIRQMAPEQRIHGSTQMTITNFEAIDLLADLNIQRFVLGRENSLSEIKMIRSQTDKELEVFVHGALCVSYSGQCFTSESLGGRSANRGQCAQSCRFAYDLYVDGEQKYLGSKKYLVSPQDLCGVEEIPELLEIGINSFKVEGRLKTPEYVGACAQEYRKIIDAGAKIQKPIFEIAKKKMATTYSRGFFSGWLHGVNHQKLVEGTFSSNRGYEFAKVVGLGEHSIQIELMKPVELHAGDGLLWSYDHLGESKELGGFIYSVEEIDENIFQIGLARELKLSSYCIGGRVFLNHDKNQKREFVQLLEDKNKKRRVSIDIQVNLQIDQPVRVEFFDGQYTVQGFGPQNIEIAKIRGSTDTQIVEELSALSASPFRVGQIKINRLSDQPLFIANKSLKEIRQELTQQMIEKRIHRPTQNIITASEFTAISEFETEEKKVKRSRTNRTDQSQQADQTDQAERTEQTMRNLKYNILLRKKEQVSDLIKAMQQVRLNSSELNTVFLDFEFGRDYLSSLELLKQQQLQTGLATTRILKPKEYNNLNALIRLKPDVILVRNLGALQYLRNHPEAQNIVLQGDFSLNVTNHWTSNYLTAKNLKTLCVSYDLNREQVDELLKTSKPKSLEVTVHQYMPSFHMEHCVFAALLSQGTSWRDCGKPCEKHLVQLRDQFGHLQEIKPDHECRNTMFNSRSQSAARFLDGWAKLGLGAIRYEALNELDDELIAKIGGYADYINGRIELQKLTEILGSVETYGLTEGQFNRLREYQSRKKS
jgi:putative protease